jgi:uncharacterized protein
MELEKMKMDILETLANSGKMPANTISVGLRGSIAHNTYIPKEDPNSIDDIDILGVYVAPLDHYIGLNQIPETKEFWVDNLDCVFYEVRKFVSMLLTFNPNVITYIWTKEEFIISETKEFKQYRNKPSMFNSKRVYKTFCGYATGQMHRMEHAKYNDLGAKRKQLVDKFGYDVKNAAHLIRLLNMSNEFLKTGFLNTFRMVDRDLLIKIKTGHYSLVQVKEMADELFKENERLFATTILPDEPKKEIAENILIDIIKKETWNTF